MINYPTKTIKEITEFIFIGKSVEKIKKSNLVIVLCSNAIIETGDKILEIINSGKLNKTYKIILSGKYGPYFPLDQPEARKVYNYLTNEKGIDSRAFILEEESTNIKENLLYSKKIIEDIIKNYNNITIVGKEFVLKRALLTASKLKYPIQKLQFTGIINKEGNIVKKDDWWKNKKSFDRVMGELQKIGQYSIEGDVDIFTE